MTRVLILSFSDPARDPRVERQIGLLRHRFALTVAGTRPLDLPGVDFVEVQPAPRPLAARVVAAARLVARAFDDYTWSIPGMTAARDALRARRFDLVIAHDLDTAPLAFEVAGGAPVIIDAHEYAPREFEDRWRWRFLFQDYRHHLCATTLRRADAVVTVCRSIAAQYDATYGCRSIVVPNAIRHHDLSPAPTRDDAIRMVHHGAPYRSRRLERMIELMDHLDQRFHLDFLLVPGEPRTQRRLEALAHGNPRIRFLPPVPLADIVPFTHRYDIGLFLLPPTNFNYRLALPNKFFEFIQARLAVAIGPSPEMANLVHAHDLGVVAPDFSPRSLADRLGALGAADIDRFKRNADRAAAELCYERLSAPLVDVIDRLVARQAVAS